MLPALAGPAVCRDSKSLPSHWRMSRDTTQCKILMPCRVLIPPHHLFPTPTQHPFISPMDASSWPADFSSPLIQMNATRSLHSTACCLTCALTRKQTQASSTSQSVSPNPWCCGLDRHRHGGLRAQFPTDFCFPHRALSGH